MREEEGEWRGRQCEYSEGEACRVSGWSGGGECASIVRVSGKGDSASIVREVGEWVSGG